MKMCRMGGEVECREVSVAWVLDQTNNQVMAVRTEEGWREIMVSAVDHQRLVLNIVVLLF